MAHKKPNSKEEEIKSEILKEIRAEILRSKARLQVNIGTFPSDLDFAAYQYDKSGSHSRYLK